MVDNTRKNNVIKNLKAFAKEASDDNKAYSRLGKDDNSYDCLALMTNAKILIDSLKTGNAVSNYNVSTYAGPAPDGFDDLLWDLEGPVTVEFAEMWLQMAEMALADIM